MKNSCYYYIFCLLLNAQIFAQSTPKVTVKDAKNLELTDVKITVDIIGNLAITTYDMKFYNELGRTLEGELAFPLAEGQTVSGFAMDVNGKMRDAVIVEKELGRVAYETTIRRRIDPGLLEKTEGNNYKARVYPIFPRTHKHIILKFEQELSTLSGKQAYELPLGISEKLDAFSVVVNVFGEQQPIVSKTSYKDFFFKKTESAYVATVTRNKHVAKDPIQIQIPNTINTEQLHTYNGYFHLYKPLKPTARLKKKPKKIAILWDASYSMRFRDTEKEFKVLQSYIEYLQDVKVDFVVFNNAIQLRKEFKIKDGDAGNLVETIKNVQYDGGTKLNILQDVKIKVQEIVLFSDGLANLGDFAVKRTMPIYTINSLIAANHQSLQDIAVQSGASYLNLLRLEYTKAVQLLKRETYQFLGIKPNNHLSEVYPKHATNVYEDFAISGQFNEDTTIELWFGYGGKVTEKIPVKIKNTEGTNAVKRLWAKQKLTELYRNKKENKGAIISLAKQHHLITDYTSMIILDRIQDYVRYKIEPPQELMQQYRQRMEAALRAEKRREEQLAYRRRNLLNTYHQIDTWYEADFKFEANEGTGNIITVHGNVVDESGMPAIAATVMIKGTATGTMTDFDGNYKLKARRGQKVVISYVGYKSKEMKIRSNFLNTKLEVAYELLDAVINHVQGVKKGTTTVATTVTAESKSQVPENSIDQILQGTATGIRVSRGTGKPNAEQRIIIRGRSSIQETTPIFIIDGKFVDQATFRNLDQNDIESVNVLKKEEATALYGLNGRNGVIVVVTKKAATANKEGIEAFDKKAKEKIAIRGWNANRLYIQTLQKTATVAEAYKKYLELREAYANNPMFYIDVADFFHSKKATDTSITIITNLLELELHNYELLRAAAYKLEYFKQYDMAVQVYKKVLEIRPEEPQSYRDLALAYEEVGKIRESYDLLYKLYDGQLLKKDESKRFTGITQIAYVELSRLVHKYPKKLKLTKKEQSVFPIMPVDVRVVIDWNQNETDIDLWVFDPTGEKAYFHNSRTQIGGKLSDDLRQGYGPEEYMVRNAVKGMYDIHVNYHSDRVQKIKSPTILKVTMYMNYGKTNEEKKIAVVHLGKKQRELEVGSLFFENKHIR